MFLYENTAFVCRLFWPKLALFWPRKSVNTVTLRFSQLNEDDWQMAALRTESKEEGRRKESDLLKSVIPLSAIVDLDLGIGQEVGPRSADTCHLSG